MELAILDVTSISTDSFRGSDFLSGITDSQVADILGCGSRTGIKDGEILFRQGDPARYCHLVTSGRLKLTKLHEQGKEAVIRYIGPGEVTSLVALFKGKEYPVSAESIGTTRAVYWDEPTLVKLMLTFPRLAVNMLRCTIGRLDELQNRFLEICTEQVEQRVARALLRIMKQSGRREADGGIVIDFPLSRQELADYTGTTIYTVSRILSAWEKKGWVKSKREQIVICDPHALVLFTENL